MPSPFPGMDPYLEDEPLWSVFQRQMVHALYQMLLPGLLDRYRARVAERHYCSEQALFTSVLREEHHESLLELRQRSDGRLVTLLEVISPANKVTGEGRQAYLTRRQEARRQNAHLVEIDLVLQGTSVLEYTRETLPSWDYAVVVSRWTQPDRSQVYPATLAKSLPRFRVPLASDDRDTVVDLQAAFTRAFDQGGFFEKIDYQRDPNTRLSAEQRDWLALRLGEEKARQ
jgi:hypothetical protein